jgi:hypothetical protein
MFIVVALCLIVTIGCTSEPTIRNSPPPVRDTGVTIHPLGDADAAGREIDGNAPLTVSAYVLVDGGVGDVISNPDLPFIVEINFGETSTWEDITDLYSIWLDRMRQRLPETYYEHTYTEPGEYTVRARVIWDDGKIVYTHPNFEPVITVTTPDDHPISIRNRIWRSADEDLLDDDYIGFFRLNAYDALEGDFKR